LGKYQTTFYNKSGSAFQSSVVGGVVTIIALLIIGFIIATQLIDVFLSTHHNLDIEGYQLQAYALDAHGSITPTLVPCERECLSLTFKDLPNILAPYFAFVITYFPQPPTLRTANAPTSPFSTASKSYKALIPTGECLLNKIKELYTVF